MINFEKYKNELLEGKYAVDRKSNELKKCFELECVECKHDNGCIEGVIEWGFKEAKFELDGRQRALCKMVETGWLAKDINGDLYYYRENAPTYQNGIWYKKEYNDEIRLISGFNMFPDFPFVTWMNSPVSIEELIS